LERCFSLLIFKKYNLTQEGLKSDSTTNRHDRLANRKAWLYKIGGCKVFRDEFFGVRRLMKKLVAIGSAYGDKTRNKSPCGRAKKGWRV